MLSFQCLDDSRHSMVAKKNHTHPFKAWQQQDTRGTQRQFSENICSEDDLRSKIFGTFVVKFLSCLALLGFSNI